MQRPRYKYLVLLFQLFLILGSSYLLYSKINSPDWHTDLRADLTALSAWKMVLLVLLSVFFWTLDTAVWRIIISPFAKISFKKALRFNMIAQTAGILTPLLVGDYGLRSILLRHYINARQNTLVTMAYQLMKVATRIIIGVLAGLLFIYKGMWSLVSLLITVGLMFTGAFVIKQLLKAIARNKYAHTLMGSGTGIDFNQLPTTKALLPATVLFLVFSLQTTLLIFWLDISSTFYITWLMVIITYSITSFLPPLSIFDPLAKSAIGALLYNDFAAPNVILLAFTVTWVLNRGVPALISSLFFRRFSNAAQETASSTT